MQNRWEKEVLQHEIHKTPNERTREHWETSNDAQIPSSDANRSTTAPLGKAERF